MSHVSAIGNKGADEWQSRRAQRSIIGPCSSRRESSCFHRKGITSHLITPRTLARRSTLHDMISC